MIKFLAASRTMIPTAEDRRSQDMQSRPRRQARLTLRQRLERRYGHGKNAPRMRDAFTV